MKQITGLKSRSDSSQAEMTKECEQIMTNAENMYKEKSKRDANFSVDEAKEAQESVLATHQAKFEEFETTIADIKKVHKENQKLW